MRDGRRCVFIVTFADWISEYLASALAKTAKYLKIVLSFIWIIFRSVSLIFSGSGRCFANEVSNFVTSSLSSSIFCVQIEKGGKTSQPELQSRMTIESECVSLTGCFRNSRNVLKSCWKLQKKRKLICILSKNP